MKTESLHLPGLAPTRPSKPPATRGALGMSIDEYRSRLAQIPKGLPALSIKQPWAWFILRPDLVGEAREERRLEFKRVENRRWGPNQPGRPQNFRGRFLIHASLGCTRAEYAEGLRVARRAGVSGTIPSLDQMDRGGIVGMAEIREWVDDDHPITEHHRLYPYDPEDDPWFFGPGALILRDAEPLPFVPCNGMLGFFNPVFPEVVAS